LMSLLKWNSSVAMWASLFVLSFPSSFHFLSLTFLRWNSCVIASIGAGLLYPATNFPVLAPLHPSEHGHAVRSFFSPFPSFFPNPPSLSQMAFYGLVRSFGQVFGIAIGSTILQNKLTDLLPVEFASQFGEGGEIAYAAIPYIKALYVFFLSLSFSSQNLTFPPLENSDEPLRSVVRAAFSDSIKVIWQTMIGIAGLGFVVSLAIQQMDLATVTDEENWGLKEKKTAMGKDEIAV
jgi:hypothetical protein